MVQAFINKLLNKQGANVTLPALQMGEDGGIDQAKALEVENQTSPLTIGQRLFGRELTKDIQTTNPTTGETSMETIKSYRPGLFQDMQAGFRDNLNNGFNPDNLKADNSKGWATRIGEGLGTAARFLDSPLGRGLLVGGIVGASGGNGLQALAYGGGATVGNQANRMKDTAYRKYLNEMGIDTNNIRGYVDDTTFKQMMGAKQLQDNAEYRKMYFDAQQQHQNEVLNWQKENARLQREAQALERAERRAENAANRAVTMRGQDLNYQSKVETRDKKQEQKDKQASSAVNMIQGALNTVKNNKDAFGFMQGALGADVSNRVFAKGTQARSIVNSVTAEYRKYLTGAQMSDRERKDYEKFLPAPTDNAEIIENKLKGMLDVISAREGIDLGSNSAPQLNVDKNALNKELKRRGLI